MARLFLKFYGGAALFGSAVTGCQTYNSGGGPQYVQVATGTPDPACHPTIHIAERDAVLVKELRWTPVVNSLCWDED